MCCLSFMLRLNFSSGGHFLKRRSIFPRRRSPSSNHLLEANILRSDSSPSLLTFQRSEMEGQRSSSAKMAGNENWFQLVEDYVNETGTNNLNLEGRDLGIHEVRFILNILRDSQVTELNLKGNRLTNGMVDLSTLLTKTKIKKLYVSDCHLTKEDLLRLAGVVQDTRITDLDISKNGACDFSPDEGLKFVSSLKKSKLTILISDFFKRFSQVEVSTFFREFLSSSITNLDLTGSKLDSKGFSFLIENLGHSSVTDLNLRATRIPPEALRQFSCRLADTKIKKLDLGRNGLKNDDLDALAAGLINSPVVELDLTLNLFSSLNSLFSRLKFTQMKTLNLCYNYRLKHEKFNYPQLRWSSLTSLNLRSCDLPDKAGKELMESLRFSNVTKLDLSWNWMSLLTVKKYVENVKDLNLTDLDLSQNLVQFHAFFMLGGCLKKSRLARIGLNDMRFVSELKVAHILAFLKLTEGSSIRHIEMNKKFLIENDRDCLSLDAIEPNVLRDPRLMQPPVCEPTMLSNTRFTELQLASKNIRSKVADLVPYLKYTSLTHLNLAENGIKDSGVVALAECLKNTRIRWLNLNNNLITTEGARTLAVTFKDSQLLYLYLEGNKIEDEGLEILAEHAKDTFISVLDVAQNPGNNVMVVEKVLWWNNTAIQKEVDVFKRIVPETMNGKFRFDQNFEGWDVSAFLDKCLRFYKVIVDGCAIGVLLQEATSFSKEEMLILMSKFPLEFSQFFSLWIEADVSEHVNFVHRVNEEGLSAVVEALLHNREAYLLDKENNILHPYVYKLLYQYDQPITSTMEPQGAIKIIEYFMEHPYIEGAQDVIILLQDAHTS